MEMEDIKIGQWYKVQKLDNNGKLCIRSGGVVEKWSTMLKFVNVGGFFTCFNSQVIEAV
jgi:hypothetical protein